MELLTIIMQLFTGVIVLFIIVLFMTVIMVAKNKTTNNKRVTINSGIEKFTTTGNIQYNEYTEFHKGFGAIHKDGTKTPYITKPISAEQLLLCKLLFANSTHLIIFESDYNNFEIQNIGELQ